MDAPDYILAVLDALRFAGPSVVRLQKLSPAECNRLLEWCDSRQLTLLLHSLFEAHLPEPLRQQMEGRRRKYITRFERLKHELFTITQAFDKAGLEFCLLKGFTHSPALTPDPISRAQGDIDLWLQAPAISSARRILRELGYRSIGSAKSRHIDPMARPSAWRWKGDYFDPDMPIAVEIHYELWSEHAEGIAVPGSTAFWDRKVSRSFDLRECGVLCDPDLIGFAAMHLLLHVLHGELPMQRAWEIGYFLHTHAADRDFWRLWRSLHSPELKRLETIVFQLVSRWFGCSLPAELNAELLSLPAGVSGWLERFWLSPLDKYWRPNKDEVWLHLALVASLPSKARIFARRLMPIHGRIFDFERLQYHFSTLAPTILAGLRSIASPRVDAGKHPRHGSGQNKQIQARRPLP